MVVGYSTLEKIMTLYQVVLCYSRLYCIIVG